MSSGSVRFFLVLVGLVNGIQAQAPGDGYPLCINETIGGMPNPWFANHPVYSANERPLMDSRDYNRLLQESGTYIPWQSVDRDNNNTGDVITEVILSFPFHRIMQVHVLVSFKWTQLGSVACEGTVTVCGFSVGVQENWLITQHINTVLPGRGGGGGGERLRKVTVQFEGTLNGGGISRESFEVYKWETSTVDRNASTNTENYVRVGEIFPDDTSGRVSFTAHQDIHLDAENGFYLAAVDLGTCVTLRRILVLYYVCPEETSELISRPEAIDFESIEGTPSVEGECVENSSTESGADPLLICGAGGQWQVMKPCLCNPGYQLDSSQDQCSGILDLCASYCHTVIVVDYWTAVMTSVLVSIILIAT